MLSVTAGAAHSAALSELGIPFTWGFGQTGVLGHGELKNESIPRNVTVLEGKSVTRLECGEAHMAALTDVGECFTWGEDISKTGKLGYAPRTGIESAVPREVKKLEGHVAREASCGGDHMAVITEKGVLITWGSNAEGQLGFENLEAQMDFGVVKELRGQRIVSVGCGYSHTVAVTELGKVYSWGSSAFGQLGHGERETVRLPRPIAALFGIKMQFVAAGTAHTVAIDREGHLWGWGLGDEGQVGVVAERRLRVGEAAGGEDDVERSLSTDTRTTSQRPSVESRGSPRPSMESNKSLGNEDGGNEKETKRDSVKIKIKIKETGSGALKASGGDGVDASLGLEKDLNGAYIFPRRKLATALKKAEAEGRMGRREVEEAAADALGRDGLEEAASYEEMIGEEGIEERFTWGRKNIELEGEEVKVGDQSWTPSRLPGSLGSRAIQVSVGPAHSACISVPRTTPSTLRQELIGLYEKGHFSDVKIKVDGSILMCHAMLLEARSAPITPRGITLRYNPNPSPKCRCPRLLEMAESSEKGGLKIHMGHGKADGLDMSRKCASILLGHLYGSHLPLEASAEVLLELYTVSGETSLDLTALRAEARAMLLQRLQSSLKGGVSTEEGGEGGGEVALLVMSKLLGGLNDEGGGGLKAEPEVDASLFNEEMLGALNSDTYGDVELKAGGSTMQAHRAMLTARSGRFRAYFLTGRREERAKLIEVPRVSYEVFFLLMDFIYTDEIHGSLRAKQAGELLKLAKEYQLARLVDICEAAIVNQAEPGDVGWVLTLCNEYHRDSRLQKHFICYAARELEEVKRYKGFQELSADAISGLSSAIQDMPHRHEKETDGKPEKQSWSEYGRYLMWRWMVSGDSSRKFRSPRWGVKPRFAKKTSGWTTVIEDDDPKGTKAAARKATEKAAAKAAASKKAKAKAKSRR